ncbi:MAG: GtrA family protein [Kiritimatiellaeota bacterium]|nr:GtrA family protein [Kiritimatiellota bacterium]
MNKTIRLWLSHEAPPWAQFVKYGVCGATATGVGILIFYACAAWLWPCLTEEDFIRRLLRLPVMDGQFEALRPWRAAWCNAVGFVLSNAVAYLTNILLVFKPGRHAWWVEVLLFYLVSGVAFFIGTTGQTLLIRHFGMMTTLAFAANIVAAFMINYAMRKFVIFKG